MHTKRGLWKPTYLQRPPWCFNIAPLFSGALQTWSETWKKCHQWNSLQWISTQLKGQRFYLSLFNHIYWYTRQDDLGYNGEVNDAVSGESHFSCSRCQLRHKGHTVDYTAFKACGETYPGGGLVPHVAINGMEPSQPGWNYAWMWLWHGFSCKKKKKSSTY